MSGYVPANTYDQVPPPYGTPIRQHPQQPYYGSDTPYTPSTAWGSTEYTGSGFHGDKEGLLGSQGTHLNISPTAQTPQSPYPSPRVGHRDSALYTAPVDHSLRHQFRQLKQFRRLFFRVLVRWLVSCLFCGAVAGLLIYYSDQGVLNKGQKYMFNALYVGISLMLALNIVASFKSMADIFRWKVLASVTYGGHSAKEMDLILGMPSYGTSMKLLRYWIKKPKYFFLLLSWILLGVGAQVILSLLGLTFSHESEGAIQTSPGTVNASMLDAFYMGQSLPQSRPWFHEQNYRSHLYGDISLVLGEKVDGGPIPIEMDESMISIIYMNKTNSFRYHFKEYVYAIHGKTREAKTKRYVTSSTKCKWAPITMGQEGANTTVEVTIDGKAESHLWAAGPSGKGTTVFLNPSINANDTELASLNMGPSKYTCGARCGVILVYRFLDASEALKSPMPSGDYFRCETTISPVQGATLPQHELPDSVAVRAACAIGSNSVWTPYPEKDLAFQTSVYNSASPWDNFNGWAGEAASVMAEYSVARYAIGSLAILDAMNPRVELQGDRPWQGVYLLVKWRFVWVTFGFLLGGQIVIGLATLMVANTVYCKDSSFLSTARLLRPLVTRMGDTGSAATGDEIAHLFGNTHMRYGARKDYGGSTHLDVLLDDPTTHGPHVAPGTKKRFVQGIGFPHGYYE